MNVSGLLAKAERYLVSRKVPEAAANAEFLMAAVLGLTRPEVRAQGSRELNDKQEHHVWHQVLERGRRVPLAYVLGNQDFMGLELRVTPAVLIPRPETEELVEEAIRLAKEAGPAPRILEIGTGSGCISIALAHLIPEASIYATELSPAALALAQDNAKRHAVSDRVRFVKEDLFKRQAPAGASAWVDLLVSNPPYIATSVISSLSPEVLQEPRLALDGGPDGLSAIREIIRQAPGLLKSGGRLALEIGEGQGEKVLALLKSAGFVDAKLHRDAQGVERIVSACLS